ncbi:hypothetical protein F7725_008475 [Dissostichus mawsoni]|uniref:PH domain-containing protein n=1 Tax=Dissostichus mawsoni TaxID=36200 RepID=A0A7J5Y798_DISMA|nr:hypothetical protein F7725_008475 [Dissostichus mawsoni]
MPDKLLYYKYDGGKRDSCQRGKILLKDCEITSPFLDYENRPLVIKLRTKNGVDHFLEACSREERDDWAGDISAATEKLRGAEGVKGPDLQTTTTTGPQLHDINLIKVLESMYDVHSGIKMGNHLDHGSLYSNCFSGGELPVARRLKKRGSVKAETSMSAVELSGKVIKRGYLLKQDDISPVGGFSLRACLVSSLGDNGVPSGVKGNIQGNLFKIITQEDTHYFIQAPTEQQKMDWIEAIRQHT